MINIKKSIEMLISQGDKSTKYKREKFTNILNLLRQIDSFDDYDSESHTKLLQLCRDCIKDKQFTQRTSGQKIIGFFFNNASNYVIISRLLENLLYQQHMLLTMKIKPVIVNENIKSNIENYDRMIKAIINRDYNTALNEHNILSMKNISLPKNAMHALEQWLIQRIDQQIKLRSTNRFSKQRNPLFERNNHQRVYHIDELINYISLQPVNKSMSFTYAIDLNKNVVFSIDAVNSHHINLCDGKEVYGAGEVYLHRNIAEEIVIDKVNNATGLYRCSEDNFLHNLKSWFEKYQFKVENIQLEKFQATLDFLQNRNFAR